MGKGYPPSRAEAVQKPAGAPHPPGHDYRQGWRAHGVGARRGVHDGERAGR